MKHLELRKIDRKRRTENAISDRMKMFIDYFGNDSDCKASIPKERAMDFRMTLANPGFGTEHINHFISCFK